MRSATTNLTETYEAKPSSVADARRALAQFAATAGATAPQVDDVRLAVSEAVTNSVVHAYRGLEGSIYVTAATAGDELWILIADDGCGLQPRVDDRPGLGLGLALIAQVSDELAIVARSSGGTELRIRFNLVAAHVRADSGTPTSAARSVCASASGGSEAVSARRR